jgi:hypothetical protein
MPASEPPVPDHAERLASVVEDVRNGVPVNNLHISAEIARLLVSSPIVHNTVLVGGTTGTPHLLYELPFNGAMWACLSPVIGG